MHLGPNKVSRYIWNALLLTFYVISQGDKAEKYTCSFRSIIVAINNILYLLSSFQ